MTLPKIRSPRAEFFFRPRVLWVQPSDRRRRFAYGRGVYALLEKAYRSIGGIDKGSGFRSVEDMQKSIPVWRIVLQRGEIVSAMVFKRKGVFLKMVAYAASEAASEAVKQADMACFLEHSHGEVSGALLSKLLKHVGADAWKYVLDPHEAMPERRVWTVEAFGKERLRNPDNESTLAKLEAQYPRVLERAYVREIGDTFKLKVLLGRLVPAFERVPAGVDAEPALLPHVVCGEVQEFPAKPFVRTRVGKIQNAAVYLLKKAAEFSENHAVGSFFVPKTKAFFP